MSRLSRYIIDRYHGGIIEIMPPCWYQFQVRIFKLGDQFNNRLILVIFTLYSNLQILMPNFAHMLISAENPPVIQLNTPCIQRYKKIPCATF
jgi:hypothetical protein